MKARALAARLGARVEVREGGLRPARCVISEYHTRSRTIVVYEDTLRLLGADPEGLEEIAIAHECFHVLKPRGDEAGAHAFARAFLGLPESPELLETKLAERLRH